MKKEKAEFLNIYIHEALDFYLAITRDNDDLIEITENEKNKYHESVFVFIFQNFIDELKENIRTYEDISVVQDYVLVCFPGIDNEVYFHEDENKWIIERGFEVHYLLCLKKTIEKYINEIQACMLLNDVVWYGTTLRNYFDKEIANLYKLDASEVIVSETIVNESKKDDRFEFDRLKAECDLLSQPVEKIKLIHSRLFDFEQWQLKHDKLIHDRDFGSYYELTAKYYQDFETLCAIELKRIEKLIEIEKRIVSIPVVKTEIHPEPKPYKWTMTDTDFLELFTALYQNECIERNDGKALTRKELIEYFQVLLGLDIKSLESKLSKAGNRNEKTPFLDDLKSAFEIFVEQKEKKLLKRK